MATSGAPRREQRPEEAPGLDARRRLWIRLIVSPATLLLVVGLLWIHEATGRALTTDLLLALVGAGGAIELVRMFRQGGTPASALAAAVATAAVAGVGLFAPTSAAARMDLRAFLPVAALFAVLLVGLRDLRREAAAGIAATLLPVVYLGLPLSLARDLAPDATLARWLVYVFVVAKASDMGGWLVGKPFGRHKLLPAVSPKKSWEGLAGGLALSVVAALFLPAALGIAAGAWPAGRRALYGLALGSASVLAGFTQSAWKRRFGVKDSSALIPEIGGVLDMADSLLLAIPVAWLWFQLDPGAF
jgi:phosphatidate cytidylyltransferase